MFKRDSERDPLEAAITAALGAGVVTSFAVSQGQNPWIALAITGVAVIIALLFDRAGLV